MSAAGSNVRNSLFAVFGVRDSKGGAWNGLYEIPEVDY